MTLLRTLFSFEGRISRSTFWLFVLAMTLLDAAILIVAQEWIQRAYPSAADFARPQGSVFGAGAVLLAVVVLSVWIGLALKVKRLHDRGRSGLYLLAAIIPVAGWLWLIWEIGFAPGRPGGARFDPDADETEDAGPASGGFVFADGDGANPPTSYGVIAPEPGPVAESEPDAEPRPEPEAARASGWASIVPLAGAAAASADPEPTAEETRAQIAEYLGGPAPLDSGEPPTGALVAPEPAAGAAEQEPVGLEPSQPWDGVEAAPPAPESDDR